MTVPSHRKDIRRSLVAEHVRRVYEQTGLNSHEQYLERVKDLAPVHRSINQREIAALNSRHKRAFR